MSLPPSISNAMREHLERAYPREGCGVLIGRKSSDDRFVLERAIGTRNAETVRGADRFIIDPRDLIAIQRMLDEQNDGSKIVGFFHSHPDAPAWPSSTDLEMAQGLFEVTLEYYIYIIVSVAQEMAKNLTCWRLSKDARDFEEIDDSGTAI